MIKRMINRYRRFSWLTDVAEDIKPPSNLYVFDGVTFWLGGNCGMSPTGIWVDTREGNAIQSGTPDRPLQEFRDELDGIPLYNHFATLRNQKSIGPRRIFGEKPYAKNKIVDSNGSTANLDCVSRSCPCVDRRSFRGIHGGI